MVLSFGFFRCISESAIQNVIQYKLFAFLRVAPSYFSNMFKKKEVAVNTDRACRSIDIASSAIPLDRKDMKCVNAIFHTSIIGHLLIALNKSNRPVCAWCDIDAIVPIKCKIIQSTLQFRSIINSIKPKCLYLNDGSLLAPMRYDQSKEPYNISPYTGTLPQLLKRLADEESIRETMANAKHANVADSIPTYETLLALDSTLTKSDYRKFCKNIQRLNRPVVNEARCKAKPAAKTIKTT